MKPPIRSVTPSGISAAAASAVIAAFMSRAPHFPGGALVSAATQRACRCSEIDGCRGLYCWPEERRHLERARRRSESGERRLGSGVALWAPSRSKVCPRYSLDGIASALAPLPRLAPLGEEAGPDGGLAAICS